MVRPNHNDLGDPYLVDPMDSRLLSDSYHRHYHQLASRSSSSSSAPVVDYDDDANASSGGGGGGRDYIPYSQPRMVRPNHNYLGGRHHPYLDDPMDSRLLPDSYHHSRRQLRASPSSAAAAPVIVDDDDASSGGRPGLVNYGQKFMTSKSKPWRNDNPQVAALNRYAEQAVVSGFRITEPKPEQRTVQEFPAMDEINPDRCGQLDGRPIGVRVVNGKDANEGSYPWMVAILKNGDSWCGGSIINSRWILTAAHCFMNDQDPKLYAIRVGTVNRNRGRAYRVDYLVMHERFHLDNMYNSDIAMLHVRQDIEMGENVNSICLPTRQYEDPLASRLLVTGWGQTQFDNHDLPTNLQEVLLTRISIFKCADMYKGKDNKIYFSQLCTLNKNQDACQGDSGGPALEYRNKAAYLVGIVSYGSTCADGMPGVFTKVSYYIDWILTQLDNYKNKKQ
ncbi:brain-specific serine protease 4-like [Oppia nitens]|uniref:brain-specific serine protease 4-like n=1 Tax=Oppia nitens TaxID=1686743 RepID=UPI0023DA8EDE|nr:brain-specific serine protease 4-like [Oppia nitens]